jgi:hypothetical protein
LGSHSSSHSSTGRNDRGGDGEAAQFFYFRALRKEKRFKKRNKKLPMLLEERTSIP